MLDIEEGSGAMEGGLEDSAFVRGKGNSRAGGIGRRLACEPSSEGSVVDEGDFIFNEFKYAPC